MAIDGTSISASGPRAVTVAEVLSAQPDLSQPLDTPDTPGKLAVVYHEADGVCTMYILNKAGTRWLRLNSPQ
jgi:hypothetical protein